MTVPGPETFTLALVPKRNPNAEQWGVSDTGREPPADLIAEVDKLLARGCPAKPARGSSTPKAGEQRPGRNIAGPTCYATGGNGRGRYEEGARRTRGIGLDPTVVS